MASSTFVGRIIPFNGENFITWKSQMEAILHKLRLLSYADGTKIKPEAEGRELETWIEKDLDARGEILLSLEPCVVSLVSHLKTSNEIWKYLLEMYERKGPRRKTEEFRKLISMRMSVSQSLEEHVREFKQSANRLAELNASIDNDFLVVLLLDSLSENFKDVRAAFDAQSKYPEFSTVCSRLLEVSDRNKESVNGNLLKVFHKPYWKRPPNFQRKPKSYFPFNCRKCGKKGHMAKDCRINLVKAGTVENVTTQSCEQGFITKEINLLSLCDSVNLTKYMKSKWCIDSGATSHMTATRELFTDFKRLPYPQYVRVANSHRCEVKGIGTVTLRVNNDSIKLYDTLYVPQLSENLISVNKATKNGCKVIFQNNIAQIYNKNNQLLLLAKEENGLFVLQNEEEVYVSCTKGCSTGSLLQWHKRLGHLNIQSLKRMQSQEIVEGLPTMFDTDKLTCTSCIRAKQVKLPFTSSETKSTKPLQLIHSDVCGPMKVESLGRSLYFITFIDDFSRKIFVYFMRRKNEALEKFKIFKSYAEKQSGHVIKTLRTDNGTEYCNRDFVEFVTQEGIKHETTVAHTPEQNGVAERANRTLNDMARCLIIDKNLPEFLWAELVHTAAYIRSRCLSKSNQNKTPEELWSGKRPNVSYFKEIGAVVYVLNKTQKSSKYEPKSEEMIHIGYCEDSKAYKLWKPGTKSVLKARDVIFTEQSYCIKQKPKLIREFQYLPEQDNDPEKKNEASLPVHTSQSIESTPSVRYNQSSESETTDTEQDIQHDPQSEESTLSETTKQLNEILNPVNESLHFGSEEKDPKTYKQLLQLNDREEWLEAVRSEYESLMKNQTWTLVDRPNKNIIGSKWVFKTKYRPDGSIERRKARLVAKGYNQIYGLDYTDTYAPVANISSIRLLLATAAEKNLTLHHIDISTAFLNGDLAEDIYMEQPEGFDEGINKVCKLRKAIYGLKQSGRQWNIKLDNVMKNLGFSASSYDCCIYYNISDDKITMIVVYVDDMLIATNDERGYRSLKKDLMRNFDIKDLGNPNQCIGLEISMDNKKISICQSGYIKNLINRYKVTNCKKTLLPMPSGIKLEENPSIQGENKPINQKSYRELIGCLLYLSIYSRPDIACAVSMLAQFSKNPKKQHWNTAIHVVKYLSSTVDVKLVYQPTGIPFYGLSDSDWASDINDRKSRSGYAFVFGGAAIQWTSRKQPGVVTSSTAAEYISLSSAAKEAEYFKYLLSELRLHQGPIIIYNDSQSASAIASFEGNQGRLKHLHVDYHYIRDAIQKGIVQIQFCPSEQLAVDPLTKMTSSDHFKICFTMLGLQF